MQRSLKPHQLPAHPPADAVRVCAYYLWLKEGRPAGCDLDLWLTAQEIVRHAPEPRPVRYRPRRRTAA